MKYLYVIRDVIPFPQSEYGEIYLVIAEHDVDCVKIISERFEDYIPEIFYIVKNATRFELKNDEKTGIVHEFTT